MADVRVLDGLILEAGAFYVMDRAYVDFQRLQQFVLAEAFYVTRSKSNLQYRRLVFLTNNSELPPLIIAWLYKAAGRPDVAHAPIQ